MKIKLFEQFTEYYTKITEEEFDTIDSGGLGSNIPFTELEYQQISDCLILDIARRYRLEYCYNACVENSILYIKNFYDVEYEVYKMSDEWYYVVDKSDGYVYRKNFYKCDQFSGLIKWIKDKFEQKL